VADLALGDAGIPAGEAAGGGHLMNLWVFGSVHLVAALTLLALSARIAAIIRTRFILSSRSCYASKPRPNGTIKSDSTWRSRRY
jgi:hypothetical protein